MTPERWNQIQSIVEAACELPADQQRVYLDSHCDPEWRADVERLLGHCKDDGFLAQPAVAVGPAGGPATGFEPGQTLAGRYEIEKVLGSGGFADVWLARDRNIRGRQVVIKAPRPQRHSTGWHQRKFRDEVQALAGLRHPSIVEVLDSGEANGAPFVVVQYVEGPTLRALIDGRPWPPARVARLVMHLARALDYAHQQGIVHRDLKPENILVRQAGTDEEQPVLIDFGIAAWHQERREGWTVVGSPAYMAPEQHRGIASPSSDIYSLGVVCFELLTGRHPDTAAGTGNTTTLRVTTQQVLDRAIARQQEERFQNVREFAESFAATLEKSRWRRRAAGIGLAAALALGALLLRPTAPDARVPLAEIRVEAAVGPATPWTPFRLDNPVLRRPQDRLRLHIQGRSTGYLYLVNESVDQGRVAWTLLYPNIEGWGAANLRPGAEISVPPAPHAIELVSSRVTEVLWVVRARAALPLFEQLRKFANPQDRFHLDEPTGRRLAEWFAARPAASLPGDGLWRDAPSAEISVASVRFRYE